MPNAIFFYRIQRWLYLHHIPFLPKLIQLLIFLIYNTKITADSKIGKGSYFVCKGISTVLIPGTEIGENCVLGLRFSTVRKFPYKNVPKIGNNVFIGPNVVICGPVEIGDNCIVAANSFVDKSLRGGYFPNLQQQDSIPGKDWQRVNFWIRRYGCCYPF